MCGPSRVSSLASSHARTTHEDIVQESLATAIEELSELRDHTAFGPWLRTIAVRQAHRYFRRRKLMRMVGLDRGADDATLASFAAPSTSPEQRAALVALDAVLSTLPADHRVAWCLRYVEGEALEDIAAACECSLATAKRWISAAHVRVTERVQLDGGTS
jgi:RNA polymerase sigma-70 factor (ECF subfamily)